MTVHSYSSAPEPEAIASHGDLRAFVGVVDGGRAVEVGRREDEVGDSGVEHAAALEAADAQGAARLRRVAARWDGRCEIQGRRMVEYLAR